MAPSIEEHSAASARSTGATGAAEAEPDGGSPWKPPMPIWRFWLLMTLTIGLYRLFWVVGVARELRRHQDPRIRPWLHMLGLLFGLTSPIVASALTGHIDRNGRRRGLDFDPPATAIVLLAVVAMLVEVGTAGFDELELWPLALVLLGTYALFIPLPWALIQHRLNRLKSAMTYPEKPVRQFQFSAGHFAAITLAIVVWPLVVIGSLPDTMIEEIFSETPLGETMIPHTPTTGPSGGYRVEVASDDWIRVESGTIAEDADLELVRRSLGTTVIVFALRGEWTMDEIVDFRRNEIGTEVRNLASHERRTLLPDSGVPVSLARYTGNLRNGGRRATWWVSTVVTDHAAYEVLGSTEAGRENQQEIEQIAKSLRLEPVTP